MSDVDELLSEQLAYYRTGAPEYDAANRSLLLANTGESWEKTYRRGHADAVSVIDSIAVGKDVLELAGGTGMYTEYLARRAGRLTVVDASPESLAINKKNSRNRRSDIEFITADLFTWTPTRRFEVVVFCFWLCHVPLARFERFWGMVDQALVDGGFVVFVDARRDHENNEVVEGTPRIFLEQRLNAETVVRNLDSGRQYRIIRVLWDRVALRDRLETIGWTVWLHDRSPWLIGSATRAK